MFLVLYRTLSLSRVYVYKTMLISFNFFLHVVLVVLGKQLTIFSWKSLPKNMHNYHKRSRYNEKKRKSQSFSRTKKKQQHYLHKPLENMYYVLNDFCFKFISWLHMPTYQYMPYTLYLCLSIMSFIKTFYFTLSFVTCFWFQYIWFGS